MDDAVDRLLFRPRRARAREVRGRYAAGFKLSLTNNAVAYFGAIFPLNDSGLRASVLPTGGIEYSF